MHLLVCQNCTEFKRWTYARTPNRTDRTGIPKECGTEPTDRLQPWPRYSYSSPGIPIASISGLQVTRYSYSSPGIPIAPQVSL